VIRASMQTEAADLDEAALLAEIEAIDGRLKANKPAARQAVIQSQMPPGFAPHLPPAAMAARIGHAASTHKLLRKEAAATPGSIVNGYTHAALSPTSDMLQRGNWPIADTPVARAARNGVIESTRAHVRKAIGHSISAHAAASDSQQSSSHTPASSAVSVTSSATPSGSASPTSTRNHASPNFLKSASGVRPPVRPVSSSSRAAGSATVLPDMFSSDEEDAASPRRSKGHYVPPLDTPPRHQHARHGGSSISSSSSSSSSSGSSDDDNNARSMHSKQLGSGGAQCSSAAAQSLLQLTLAGGAAGTRTTAADLDLKSPPRASHRPQSTAPHSPAYAGSDSGSDSSLSDGDLAYFKPLRPSASPSPTAQRHASQQSSPLKEQHRMDMATGQGRFAQRGGGGGTAPPSGHPTTGGASVLADGAHSPISPVIASPTLDVDEGWISGVGGLDSTASRSRPPPSTVRRSDGGESGFYVPGSAWEAESEEGGSPLSRGSRPVGSVAPLSSVGPYEYPGPRGGVSFGDGLPAGSAAPSSKSGSVGSGSQGQRAAGGGGSQGGTFGTSSRFRSGGVTPGRNGGRGRGRGRGGSKAAQGAVVSASQAQRAAASRLAQGRPLAGAAASRRAGGHTANESRRNLNKDASHRGKSRRNHQTKASTVEGVKYTGPPSKPLRRTAAHHRSNVHSPEADEEKHQRTAPVPHVRPTKQLHDADGWIVPAVSSAASPQGSQRGVRPAVNTPPPTRPLLPRNEAAATPGNMTAVASALSHLKRHAASLIQHTTAAAAAAAHSSPNQASPPRKSDASSGSHDRSGPPQPRSSATSSSLALSVATVHPGDHVRTAVLPAALDFARALEGLESSLLNPSVAEGAQRTEIKPRATPLSAKNSGAPAQPQEPVGKLASQQQGALRAAPQPARARREQKDRNTEHASRYVGKPLPAESHGQAAAPKQLDEGPLPQKWARRIAKLGGPAAPTNDTKSTHIAPGRASNASSTKAGWAHVAGAAHSTSPPPPHSAPPPVSPPPAGFAPPGLSRPSHHALSRQQAPELTPLHTGGQGQAAAHPEQGTRVASAAAAAATQAETPSSARTVGTAQGRTTVARGTPLAADTPISVPTPGSAVGDGQRSPPQSGHRGGRNSGSSSAHYSDVLQHEAQCSDSDEGSDTDSYAPLPPPGVERPAEILAEFTGDAGQHQLSFLEEDVGGWVDILQSTDSGWWYVKRIRDAAEGYVPGSYVEECDPLPEGGQGGGSGSSHGSPATKPVFAWDEARRDNGGSLGPLGAAEGGGTQAVPADGEWLVLSKPRQELTPAQGGGVSPGRGTSQGTPARGRQEPAQAPTPVSIMAHHAVASALQAVQAYVTSPRRAAAADSPAFHSAASQPGATTPASLGPGTPTAATPGRSPSRDSTASDRSSTPPPPHPLLGSPEAAAVAAQVAASAAAPARQAPLQAPPSSAVSAPTHTPSKQAAVEESGETPVPDAPRPPMAKPEIPSMRGAPSRASGRVPVRKLAPSAPPGAGFAGRGARPPPSAPSVSTDEMPPPPPAIGLVASPPVVAGMPWGPPASRSGVSRSQPQPEQAPQGVVPRQPKPHRPSGSAAT